VTLPLRRCTIGSVAEPTLTLNEAAERVGVSPSTLRRWAESGVIPEVDGRGEWTAAAVAHARIVARLRARGHTLESLRQAGSQGRLAYGYIESLFGDDQQAERNLKDASRPLPEIVQLFDDRVVQNVRDCIGANFTLEGAWMWRNTWYPHELIDVFEAHGNRWHFDDQSPDLVHAFIFLQDITEKDGPFQCFDRPYSRYLLSRGFDKEKRRVSVTGGLEDRYFEGSHLKLHTGAFGTMVLCATSFCLHRGGILATGHHRDMLSVTIKPAAEMGLRIP